MKKGRHISIGRKPKSSSTKQRGSILRECGLKQLFFALGIALSVLLIILFAVSSDHTDRYDAPESAPLQLKGASFSCSEVVESAFTIPLASMTTPTPGTEPAGMQELGIAAESTTALEHPVPAGSAPKETQPIVIDEPVEDAAQLYSPNAPFSYDLAYAAAVLGVDTGEAVAPDYSYIDPAMLARWPNTEEGFMPMLSHANTTEHIIAVTVDDCFQADNLHDIVQCALNNGARLTLFPIGTNLEKPNVAREIRNAWICGMEIENHTYSHAGTYHYDDAGMADDIFRQSYMLNQVLGVNYQEHFFRPKGGDERFDQRTHAYIRQCGFAAMALWTQSGSVDSMNSLLNGLSPGNIYLFHTTDNDLNKLLKFIPAAIERGYRLVTLNELFGLSANDFTDLSTAPTATPQLAVFRVLPMTLKPTAYARAAAVVQERLIQLGWMHGEPTGVYGKTTAACIKLFQMATNQNANGAADIGTQQLLFSTTAPIADPDRLRALAAETDDATGKTIEEMLKEYP